MIFTKFYIFHVFVLKKKLCKKEMRKFCAEY